jgi:Kef-type K+ transport system membrane component KefB
MPESSADAVTRRETSSRVWIGYAVLLAAAVAGFFVIRHYGSGLVAPPAAPQTSGVETAAASGSLLRVLIALIAVIVTGQLLSRLLARLHQPPVIGEVLAGILLGPSLIGPELSALVLPPSVAPFLQVIAQLGVVLYMFLVGLELQPGAVRQRLQAVIGISHAGIVVPFLLGALVAVSLYPRFSSSDVPFTNFGLFIGVAMSITAFPVLARILSDRGLARTEVGIVALSAAAIGDVTAWCLLAVVVGIVKAQAGAGLVVVAGAAAYIAVMIFIARPLIVRFVARADRLEPGRMDVALLFVALLVSALVTEAIGIHAIFGAFLLGALVPHESALARTLTRQLHDLVTILLLPAFFAFTGMRTRIDLLSGTTAWLACGLIILVATVGKVGATFVAARLTGFRSRDAVTLGVLMNTRGLMELIVLNVGLELGVISPALFAMMVLMALATTLATGPALRWLKTAH